jgi:hypothetical protein
MRETVERHIVLKSSWSSQETIDALEREAERMYNHGWRYTGSHVDRVLENVVLCFERELKVVDYALHWRDVDSSL